MNDDLRQQMIRALIDKAREAARAYTLMQNPDLAKAVMAAKK